MDSNLSVNVFTSKNILLIGPGELPDATQRALHAATARVIRLAAPSDAEIRAALSERVDSVIVISRDDSVALRLALIVEYVRPGVHLIVTVHSRIVAAQLRRAVPNIHVTSMARIVAPTLAAPCLGDGFLWVRRTPAGFTAVRADNGQPQLADIGAPGARLGQRLLMTAASPLRPFEPSARILTVGAVGFLLILAVETLASAVVLRLSPVDAFYAVTKAIVTVGPNSAVDQGPDWFKMFSAAGMLIALAFTALFTAGVVDRLLGRRLVTMLGSGVIPRSNHVVVVGLGEVGLRLCLLLREFGMPVVAVEKDPERYNVARAKNYGLPVVIGLGASHFLLKRLTLPRARALVAVTSDEVENISIAVAALGMHQELRTILRAGRGDVINETRSLFHIGVVRDVYRIGGSLLAAAALGSDATEAFLHEHTVYLITPDDRIEPFAGDLGHCPTTPLAQPA